MAMAIALDYELAATGFGAIAPLTVVTFSVMINDILGYALTRRVLISTGEAPGPGAQREDTR
jgi:hypothetical protein